MNQAAGEHHGWACDYCKQNPITGPRIHGSDFTKGPDADVITTCRTCFLQVPDACEKFIFIVIPPPLKSSTVSPNVEGKNTTDSKGMHATTVPYVPYISSIFVTFYRS